MAMATPQPPLPKTKLGMAPGSVVYTGEQKVEAVTLELIRYTPEVLREVPGITFKEALAGRAAEAVSWLNITGLHDTALIKDIGEVFELHPLVLEDIVSPRQRPKVEYFDGYIYIVMRMLHFDKAGEMDNEQLSIVLGPDYVLTFQERSGDVFEPVRERIRHGRGRIRKLGPDYLAYALMDIMVDTYFAMLESYGETIEALEEELLHDPSPKSLEKVTGLKRDMLYLRKAVWPLRELISSLLRDESPLISETVRTFMRDVYDHAIQVIDTVETLRDVLSGLHDFYLSSLSFKMNEVMKVLTIVGTIFIPLGFLAGIFGMNFDRMPELHWRYGYAMFWLFVLFLAGGMLWYFRCKKWL